MQTTALLATAVDRVELVEATIPEPGAGQVVLKAVYTAISPGTEMRCLAGRQSGLSFPFVPGYSMVGQIAERGPGVAIAEGAWVFCQVTQKADRPLAWGGHISHALCGEGDVFLLPAGIDPLEAALAKLGAIAYRGVRVAGTRPHDQVAVVGLGPIGQLAARMHGLTGARVVAADVAQDRVALAKAAGIEAVVARSGIVDAFAPLLPQGADVVVDATGAPAVLRQSILLAKSKPWDNALTEPTRLIVQGSYPENVVFDYQEAFMRELSVHFPRDNQARDVQAVLGFLARGRLKIRDLISEVCAPRDAQQIYTALRAGKPGLITGVFHWQ
jgi:2-desacetyl-2-hydroxyethyl bacteriochlorophyllide A dehydrogenase